MINQQQSKEDRLVNVHCIRPFRLAEGKSVRVVQGDKLDEHGNVVEACGEDVQVEFWMANMLANHHPPKVGPVTQLGKTAARRAAA